jgi:hypothetical protein
MFNHSTKCDQHSIWTRPRSAACFCVGLPMLSLCPFTLILDLHFRYNMRLEVDQSILARVNGPWVRMDIREFNELQHNFERRMGPSYEKQKDISVCLVKTEIVTCWKNPCLIGGSLGAVLLVFAMINDSFCCMKIMIGICFGT